MSELSYFVIQIDSCIFKTASNATIVQKVKNIEIQVQTKSKKFQNTTF